MEITKAEIKYAIPCGVCGTSVELNEWEVRHTTFRLCPECIKAIEYAKTLVKTNDMNTVELTDEVDKLIENQEDINYDTGVIGDKVLDRPLTEELEEVAIYRTNKDKKSKFPCQSCTKVDEACIPTDFEGGGCGKCPKYENRVWANILKEKEEKDRHITNKELAMWLAQGKGQVQDMRTGRISTNYYYFEYDDSQVDYMNIAVRKWGDDKWNYPTYGYCFGKE